jgi:ATP-dependent Zn protease
VRGVSLIGAESRYCIPRTYLENQLSVALGGRVAEEIIFGEDDVTTGASSDFMQVRVGLRAGHLRLTDVIIM